MSNWHFFGANKVMYIHLIWDDINNKKFTNPYILQNFVFLSLKEYFRYRKTF